MQQVQRALAASPSVASDRRARSLAMLVPQVTGAYQRQACAHCLQAIRAMTFQQEQSWSLQQVAAYLPPDMLGDALNIAIGFWYERDRAPALRALAPHVTVDLIQQMLDAALALQDEVSKADIIVALAPKLVRVDTKPGKKRRLWFRSAQPQDTGLLDQAYEAAISMKRDFPRAWLLVVLIPYMPENRRSKLLESTLKFSMSIPEHHLRSAVLLRLIPELVGRPWLMALVHARESALIVENEANRVELLLDLIPYMNDESRKQVANYMVKMALEIKDDTKRKQVFAKIMPHLSEDLRIFILDSIAAMPQSVTQLEIFAQIAPSLTEKEQNVIFNYTFNVIFAENFTSRYESILCQVIPLLPEAARYYWLARLFETSKYFPIVPMAVFLPLIYEDRVRVNGRSGKGFIRATLLGIILSLLKDGRDSSRAEILQLCAVKSLFSETLLSAQLLNTMVSHIIEICHEWDWTQ